MPTFAAEIQPQSQGTTYARTFLTINQSGLASCTIDVDARQSSFRIEETMTLYRIKDSNYIQLNHGQKQMFKLFLPRETIMLQKDTITKLLQ